MFSSLHIYCSPTVCFSEASLNCVTARRCAARLRPERAFTSAATVMKVDRVHVCERRAAVCEVGIFKDREHFVSSGAQSYFGRWSQFGEKKKKKKNVSAFVRTVLRFRRCLATFFVCEKKSWKSVVVQAC